jgi:hypothetical protein
MGNERTVGPLLMRQNDGWQNDWDSENHFAIDHSAKGTDCARFERLKPAL